MARICDVTNTVPFILCSSVPLKACALDYFLENSVLIPTTGSSVNLNLKLITSRRQRNRMLNILVIKSGIKYFCNEMLND